MSLALLVGGLLAGWVASAGAGLPQLPTLPTLPTLPQVPTLPVLPNPPRPPQVPALPKAPPVAPAPPVSQPALPLGGSGNGTSSSGSGLGADRQSSGGHAGSRPSRVYGLHFSRNWISRTGPKERRHTVLVFTLRKAGVVEFLVIELSPDCRRIGRFRVMGRPGVNRVRFRGHIGRRLLGPGTYRITARTLPRGRAVVDTKLVVVMHPDSAEIASGRSANACGSGTRGQSTSSTGSNTPAQPGAGSATPAAQGKAEKQAEAPRAHGVLGTRFTKRAVVDAVKSIPLWLFVLLGLAIALLAVAALPLRAAPTRRGASALAHHRGVVALAGAAALVAVTVSYALH